MPLVLEVVPCWSSRIYTVEYASGSPDEFLIGGSGIVITFENSDKDLVTNIAAADEVSYENGKEIKGRRMNGDQDHQGRHVRFSIGEWGIQKVKLYNSLATIEN